MFYSKWQSKSSKERLGPQQMLAWNVGGGVEKVKQKSQTTIH